MNIVIIGCGKVGATLTKTLVAEKHSVTIIDTDNKKVEKLALEVDCMGITGNGAIQSVQKEAEIDKADYLIACTSNDEVNILACMIARKSTDCCTIARIRNPEYTKQVNYIMKELDISTTINPELATSNEILRILRYPSSLYSDSFFKGRLNLLQTEIPNNSKVIGKKLYEISKELGGNILICAIKRDNDWFVPTGFDTIEQDDKICFLGEHLSVTMFFKYIGFSYKSIESCMIVGGGKISKYLINRLVSNKYNCNIKVIDIDHKVCEELATQFPSISVVCGDATDKNMLISEGLYDVDSFISLTNMDEQNIVLSLFANRNKKAKVITKVNHLNFFDSLDEIDVGSIINPEKVAANMIISYVRGSINAFSSNIETMYKICDDKLEALEFKIKDISDVVNVPFKNLKIKKNIIIAGIYRDSKLIIPNGNDELKLNDRVIVVSKEHKLNSIVEVLK